MVVNSGEVIDINNQVPECFEFWLLPVALNAIAGALLIFLVGFEVYTLVVKDEISKFSHLYGDDTNYFSRLSNLDRKRWLAEETYLRNELGIQLSDANTLAKLRETKAGDFSISFDPPNFNILSN
jgi:hypothetical protein